MLSCVVRRGLHHYRPSGYLKNCAKRASWKWFPWPSTVQSFRCSGRKHATSYVFEGRCENTFDNIVHFYTPRKAQASICWCIFMSFAHQNEGFALIFRPYREWLDLDVSCYFFGYNLSIYHFVTVPFQVVWEIPVTFLSLSFSTCGLFSCSWTALQCWIVRMFQEVLWVL